MQTLASVDLRSSYVILQINGEKALTRRLREVGMIKGRIINVISTNQNSNGLVVMFQGQRFALSESMARCIEVGQVEAIADANDKNLADIPVGKPCVITKVNGDRTVRKRLMDMGLTRNTMVTITKVAPLGDPLELVVRGYHLSIRKYEAQTIMVQEVD